MEIDSHSQCSDEGAELSTSENGELYQADYPFLEDSQPSFLEAKVVYLLMQKNVPISRASRLQWLLDHLDTTISPSQKLTEPTNNLEVISAIPREQNLSKCNRFLVTYRTEVKFLASSYRFVYCLDMSPSQANVDIQKGEILFDEILNCFRASLDGLCREFMLPGNSQIFQPCIYLTVIVNTPFFMSPAQQVLVKGVQITSDNINVIVKYVEKQFHLLEGKIADVSAMALDQLDFQRGQSEALVGSLFDIPETGKIYSRVSMVTPDVNFVNMLRYSMLAISLLPENSLSHILVITDGIVAMPDSNIMESLLFQLHFDSIAISFLKVGSTFHPHASAGFVSYTDLLYFFAHSTLGTCLENFVYIKPEPSMPINIYHELFLLWSFHSANKYACSKFCDNNNWTSSNEMFYSHKVPTLLSKRQTDEDTSASILLLISRRMREGFTVDNIFYINGTLEIKLILQWKSSIYIHYKVKSQWPLVKNLTHFEIYVSAPYEFLHDITCPIKKETKSSYRTAIINRFWLRLSQLSSGDMGLANQLSSFQCNKDWFTLPDSVRNGIPVFILNSSGCPDTPKLILTPSDLSCIKFVNIWQSICQMETNNWRKWFHTHKLSLILRHDIPLPKHLHLANASQRFQVVQCRQAATALYGFLSDWSSFILIDNHTYLKLLYKEAGKPPAWFCIVRVSSKFPCAVLNIGFYTGTPGPTRFEICEELKGGISSLCYLSNPSKVKESFCCMLLQKPLEKILIRYERIPNNYTTVIFPDGTQPPPNTVLNLPSPVTGTLFTTLSRYLFHKRWIWSATLPSNPRLPDQSISRILSTLTSMRIREGYNFAHSSSGIITMVQELWMEPSATCVVQYVLFPPHSACLSDDIYSGSEDDNEQSSDIEEELQMVTEVWIEPQYGKVRPTNPKISYIDNKHYYEIADEISKVDLQCISSLLTMEHLSLMCQEKTDDRFNISDSFSNCNHSNFGACRKHFSRMNSKNSCLNSPSVPEQSIQWYPITSPRIEHIPFKFDPITILPLCQQTELLFSMFIEAKEKRYLVESNFDKANRLLLDNLLEHLGLLHDQELDLTKEDSERFTEEIFKRHNTGQTHKCPISNNLKVNQAQENKNKTGTQWRCFIKGVSVTHVILTFINGSLEDLRNLMTSENSNIPSLNNSVEENTERASSRESNFSDVPINTSNSICLPIYVFDCPLVRLVNSYISSNESSIPQNEDVYEDHRFRNSEMLHEELLRTCNKKHNTTLHRSQRFPEPSSTPSPDDSESAASPVFSENTAASHGVLNSQSIVGFSSTSTNHSTVLLSTALLETLDVRGNFQICRAVLDTGSQISFISQKCANRLGLPISKMFSEVQSIGDTRLNSQVGSVCLSVRPVGKVNVDLKVNAVVLSKICSDLPTTLLPVTGWKHIQNLKLADDTFATPGSIDILLGADVFPYIIQSGRIEGQSNEPIALNTIFGFVIMGKFAINNSKPAHSFFCRSDDMLNEILQIFWKVENVPEKVILSPEDELCEKKYSESVRRNSEGRFIVELPFRDEKPSFSYRRDLAIKRFLSLERRLLRNPALYSEYSQFIQEYLDLHHMKLVQDNSSAIDKKCYFIPHHCVLRPDNTTTKLRVVFNASAKMGTDLSLNETLLVGPKLQSDVVSILLNFRLHNVVLCADITKMYGQILIAPEHQNYQRIIWRFSNSDPISEYKLLTVTYGVNSAPYLALRTLRQLADEEGSRFPRAAFVLKNDTYVDDIVTGCSSVEDAIVLQHELTLLLQQGGFDLHKWSSNIPEVLKNVPKSLDSPPTLCLDCDETTKVLGLRWHPSSDKFIFHVEPLDRPCTKRNILSEIARVFDPLGFLTPITFLTKTLMQKLWVLGLDWDSHPPDDICNFWNRYKSELLLLSNFQLPRLIGCHAKKVIELHGFADSSEKGYAAVVYARIPDGDSFLTYFVCAKSRVAPLRTLSIPRLELCAAVLLSELITSVISVYQNKINFTKIYAWSDSTIALSWIKSHPHKWKNFVSNRVSLIQERVPPSHWLHCSSSHNAADIASRGSFPSELVNHTSWWAGPDFLRTPVALWPSINDKFNLTLSELNEEMKDVSLTATQPHSDNILDILLNKFSSLDTMKRILAYILRFLNNCKVPSKCTSRLSFKELHTALLILVTRQQEIAFADVILKLKNHQKLPKPFQKLSIFHDVRNILRVGGRLHHSTLSYDKKYPILLPRNNRLTYLIIEHIHLKYFHAGVQSVQFLLCQNFWVLSAKRAIRHVLSRCVRCFKLKPVPYQPIMGNLPSPRISEVKPFLHTGVDYGGPYPITLGKNRGAKSHKAYICLFVCLATKALHLELASDLTAEAFIAALRRFVARRGRCSFLYCDNATNFVAADKLLEAIAGREQISFIHIPPSSPNFGGLWEAGIKSVKTHLQRVIGSQRLTYEEFYTILCQIEAILNSRPMTPISCDPNDLSALTPGHFLTLEPLTAVPDDDLKYLKLNRLNRWQLLQRLHQDFWTRYQREYLHTLQQKGKWMNSTSPSKLEDLIGTLVLIKEDNSHPLQWRLGRIIAGFPGSDGTIRVARVQTVGGVLKRPLSKLCPLPISNHENA